MAEYKQEVLTHINMMQDIIKRMASNSSSCKQWCILVISAILTFSVKATELKFNICQICSLPLISFCFLDCYYLSLEREFRKRFNDFVFKVNCGRDMKSYLFVVSPIPYADDYTLCEKFERFVCNKFLLLGQVVVSFFSFSIFPFYVGIYLLLRFIVNN